ncbi:hypothetical protein IEQ34_018903 [Dendrobium chrysotoxum]|uniref:Uncharacterized protein n=1 Tax=Dendrobium chrysotoxum TaxID=161865 RepID=A0AAV7FPS2_DENCH|nr:hypothetical protein IEQ34_018903 [Dendrobium chrysotoxum]
MMKAAGWDLDAAINAIEASVVYARRVHKKYAFEAPICQRLFKRFEEESFCYTGDLNVTNEGFFHQFLAIWAMSKEALVASASGLHHASSRQPCIQLSLMRIVSKWCA